MSYIRVLLLRKTYANSSVCYAKKPNALLFVLPYATFLAASALTT